jgi:hypothetical protein
VAGKKGSLTQEEMATIMAGVWHGIPLPSPCDSALTASFRGFCAAISGKITA